MGLFLLNFSINLFLFGKITFLRRYMLVFRISKFGSANYEICSVSFLEY